MPRRRSTHIRARLDHKLSLARQKHAEIGVDGQRMMLETTGSWQLRAQHLESRRRSRASASVELRTPDPRPTSAEALFAASQRNSTRPAIVVDLCRSARTWTESARELAYVDVLVNNAGTQYIGACRSNFLVEGMGIDSRLVKPRALFLTPCRGALLGMYECGWGRIVNVALGPWPRPRRSLSRRTKPKHSACSDPRRRSRSRRRHAARDVGRRTRSYRRTSELATTTGPNPTHAEANTGIDEAAALGDVSSRRTPSSALSEPVRRRGGATSFCGLKRMDDDGAPR